MVKSGQKEPWFAHIIQVFQYWTVEDLEAEPSASGSLPQPQSAVFLRWYDRIRDSTAKGCSSGQVEAALAAAVMPPLVRLKWANSSEDMEGHYDCCPISTILHPVRVTPDESTPGVFVTDGLVLEE
ncbi:g2807 [Coccomyxa elongata]